MASSSGASSVFSSILSPIQAVTGIFTSVFGAISSYSLKKQYQDFEEQLQKNEQTFKQELGVASQASSNANTSTEDLNNFYTTVGKNNNTTYMVAAGIIVIAGLGTLYFLSKNKKQ